MATQHVFFYYILPKPQRRAAVSRGRGVGGGVGGSRAGAFINHPSSSKWTSPFPCKDTRTHTRAVHNVENSLFMN